MTIWGLPNSSSLKIPNSLIRAQAEFMPLMYGDESVGVVATGSLPYEKQSTLQRIERMQPL